VSPSPNLDCSLLLTLRSAEPDPLAARCNTSAMQPCSPIASSTAVGPLLCGGFSSLVTPTECRRRFAPRLASKRCRIVMPSMLIAPSTGFVTRSVAWFRNCNALSVSVVTTCHDAPCHDTTRCTGRGQPRQVRCGVTPPQLGCSPVDMRPERQQSSRWCQVVAA
jgi:hypothetical protein